MMNTVNKNPAFNIWEGVYSNFQEAYKFRVGLGFSGSTYIKRSMEVAIKCRMALRNNRPIPIFHKQRGIYLPITVGMMLGSSDKIKVLDFGGGLGIGYMSLQESIGSEVANVNYNIIEVPEVCQIASDLHVGNDLVYSSHLPTTGVFDLIHAASSIQYIEKWKDVLIKFTQLEPEYILLSDIFAGHIQSYVTLQNYYESKIPHWMLNIEEILQLFKIKGYRLVMKEYANSRRLDAQDILPMINFPEELRLSQTLHLLFRKNGDD